MLNLTKLYLLCCFVFFCILEVVGSYDRDFDLIYQFKWINVFFYLWPVHIITMFWLSVCESFCTFSFAGVSLGGWRVLLGRRVAEVSKTAEIIFNTFNLQSTKSMKRHSQFISPTENRNIYNIYFYYNQYHGFGHGLFMFITLPW